MPSSKGLSSSCRDSEENIKEKYRGHILKQLIVEAIVPEC